MKNNMPLTASLRFGSKIHNMATFNEKAEFKRQIEERVFYKGNILHEDEPEDENDATVVSFNE